MTRDPHKRITAPAFAAVDPGELGDTQDDPRDLTPVEDLAAEIRAEIDRRVELTPREVELRDAFTESAATRLAQHLAHAHRVGVGTPRRLVQLESWRTEVDAWRMRLTGVADSNGRMGIMGRTIDEIREDLGTPAERRIERAELVQLRKDVGTTEQRTAERKTVGAVRWTTAKVLALLSASGLIAGGGAWQAIRARATAKEAIAAAAARVEATHDEHERAQDRRLDDLFTLCTARTP